MINLRSKFLTALSLLAASAIAAHAQLSVDFTNGDGFATTTLTFSDIGGTPGLNDGSFTTTFGGDALVGVTGQLSVTFTAYDHTVSGAGTGTNDPTTWTFNDTANFDTNSSGIGVSSVGDTGGGNQFGNGEVILLEFDVSQITSGAENLQFYFEVGGNESWRTYRRDSATSAVVATATEQPGTGPTTAEPKSIVGSYQTATDQYDFVLADAGWDGGALLRYSTLYISAVPEPSTYALIGGLVALGVVLLRRRK